MKVEELTLKNFNGRNFKLTFFRQEENKLLKKPDRPLALVIPGGSFNHYSIREGEPTALAFVSRGYDAAILYYNLVQDSGDIYPDAALSGLSAIQYFRKNAQKLGIDAQQIITIGFSAGGHVAAMMNSFAGSQKMQAQYGFAFEDVQANATILGYPLIDVKLVGLKIPAEQLKFIPQAAFLRDASTGVNELTPPTFIFQAVDDPIVLIDNALIYIKALRAKQRPFEAHLFDHGGHGFGLATPELELRERPWQNDAHLVNWFQLSLEWLTRLFAN